MAFQSTFFKNHHLVFFLISEGFYFAPLTLILQMSIFFFFNVKINSNSKEKIVFISSVLYNELGNWF